VVGIDLQIALRAHRQVQSAVLGQLREHVVEERHTGLDGTHARAIDFQFDQHVAFLGNTLHARGPTHRQPPLLDRDLPALRRVLR
jgi:hypothetical protein